MKTRLILVAAVIALPLFALSKGGSAQSPVVPPVVVPVGPQPTPAPPKENVVVATFEGPSEVPPGKAFAVYYTVTEAAPNGDKTVITWNNAYPKGATPGAKMTDETGRRMLVFFDSVSGEYKFNLQVQYPVNGLDPFAYATHTVMVGKKPAPTPPQPTPTPPKPAPPAPSVELQQLVAPIKAILLKGDATKVATWREAWEDYQTMLKAGGMPNTVATYKSGMQLFLRSVAFSEGLENSFPGFSSAMDVAFATRFGTEDAPLDTAKALEFVQAVIWACSR